MAGEAATSSHHIPELRLDPPGTERWWLGAFHAPSRTLSLLQESDIEDHVPYRVDHVGVLVRRRRGFVNICPDLIAN